MMTLRPSVTAIRCLDPAGVFVLISPWNAPLMLATWQIAGRLLAARHTVVVKPSGVGPAHHFMLCATRPLAGRPPGY